MNILTYGAEDLNGTFPKFDEVSGLFGFETTNPLYGRASVSFDQSQVQYLGRAFPYTPVLNSWQGFHFKASSISACGLVQWLTGTSSRGDLRFNSSRKLEARVNGSLVKTSSKIFNAATRYHLQLFVTVNGTYQWIQVKVDDKPLFVLDYFLNSGADPANYDRFRWGPFLGGGSGTLLFDDLWLNDADATTGGNYSWPGRIAFTDAGPNGEGTDIINQWGATGAQTVPDAIDELSEDEDITFAHTETNRRRHAITFANPSQPIGGILQTVGFDVIARLTNLADSSDETEGKVKLRFRTPGTTVNEIQTIRIEGGETGDVIQFGYEDQLSAELDFDASVATVQAEADAIFGDTGVVVSGTPGEEYVFTFAEHWSQTRMLEMQVAGSFASSVDGSIAVERTQLGFGIYETGTPFVYVPAELADDALTDPYPEGLSTTYESRSAMRRVALDGGSWNKTKADAVQLVLRSDIPFTLGSAPGGGGDEGLPLGAEDGLAVVNEGGINAFGINVGTGAEGEETPIEQPHEPPSGEVDFRLLPGSPALDFGTAIGEVTTDIRGRSRDASPSAGAYEGEY